MLFVIVPVLLVLVEGGLYLSHYKKNNVLQGGCAIEEKTIVADDPEMKGLVEPGKKLTLSSGWYQCHPLVDGDLVLYRYSSSADPVIRIVRAVEDDKIKLSVDKKYQAWNLLVNGDMVMGVNKEPYHFGNSNPSMLSLYMESRKKGLLPGDVILFASQNSGHKDSGAFGIANVKDVVGKLSIAN